MTEYVKIHVERYRIGDEGISENMACAEHTFSATQLKKIHGRVLLATVWKLVDQTAEPLAEDQT